MHTIPVRRRPAPRAGLLLALLALAGCGLLDTQSPTIVRDDGTSTPGTAATKRLGAITQFALAKDGDIPLTSANDGADGVILVSGVLADEFVNPGFIPSRTEVDLRKTPENNVTLSDLFRSMHRSRAAAEDAAAALLATPDPDANTGIPEMLSLAGYMYVMFAETFCSGVPVSRIVSDTIVYGTPLTTAQLLDTAVARFTAARAHPSIALGDPIYSLASVGLGRALLDQGNFAQAATAVTGVPSDFLYVTEHAQTPEMLHNSVAEAVQGGQFGTFDIEGGVGMPYVSANDPRVTGDSGIGSDNNTPTWKTSKYPAFDSPVTVADYTEAQLIIAEGQLRAPNLVAMRTTLNTLRATIGLAALPVPGNATIAADQLFRERAFWLFATGHRLGDMRRLIRQYARATNTVFPNGTYYKGGLTYGPDVTLPIPRTETNNPNVQGCLDRNP